MATSSRSLTKRPPEREIENFLYEEAHLIDQGKLEEWLSLFTDDAIYWIPCNRYDTDPSRALSIIYDDRQHLEDRAWRLQSGLAHTTDPPFRLRHFVSNVRLGELVGDELTVYSNFLLVTLRPVRGWSQQIFAGGYVHRLRRLSGSWKIAFKKVELLNNDEPILSLQFIV